LTERYREIRRATESLCEPLSPEDCTVQSMPDASPAKWHLGHTSWFFDTFLLEGCVADGRLFPEEYRLLFNSYYNSIGEQHPRPRRGLLTRPSLEEVLAYRAEVDRRLLRLLEELSGGSAPLAELAEVGLQHEQQHQELILTDIKHLLSCNPLRPAYQKPQEHLPGEPPRLEWYRYEGGTYWIGHEGSSFSFDNERPRHRTLLEPFELASRPVTNGEFLEFIEAGGYENPELWLSDGWSVIRDRGWRAPLYWEERNGAWSLMTLSGLRSVRSGEPVCHVSFYEADAFARWMGARLPTEAEWEVAAAAAPMDGNFAEERLFHPDVARARAPREGPAQVFGDVWEWTQSSYGPYPGYVPPPGALGEYNGKFMCNQMVLRGGSCATPRAHIRPTYRNFFYPDARWQFSGLRLAREVR
jgi:ergothioneine biosynthesis protein EgtB